MGGLGCEGLVLLATLRLHAHHSGMTGLDSMLSVLLLLLLLLLLFGRGGGGSSQNLDLPLRSVPDQLTSLGHGCQQTLKVVLSSFASYNPYAVPI